jgi:membrane-associated protease RseP (regulator of RpoE activity)
MLHQHVLGSNAKGKHDKNCTASASLTVAIVAIALQSSLAQSPTLPTDQGMYVQTISGFSKIIGQIAEFRRSGSALVSRATVGIKSQKVNIQLLGRHAPTVVSSKPVFYFIPAKQEADAGVNAGDLILVRLEEKAERRQFEIAASGAWRSSSGISLTHQVQLLRSEVKSGVYTIAPAIDLSKGEYALYLSRGQGMAPYVYDFGVQESKVSTNKLEATDPRPGTVAVSRKTSDAATNSPRIVEEASIGAITEGNPDIRHDGVRLKSITAGGPADQAGIEAGDVIVAIDNHYLFTVRELNEEISRHEPGARITVRYRRYLTIYEASLVVGKSE